MNQPWHKHYPPGVPPVVDVNLYRTLTEEIDPAIVETHGVVSGECAAAMAAGARLCP